MTVETQDERVTIRELQRNAAELFDRARGGAHFVVTRRGEEVGRIVPPDPAAEAVQEAVASGVLDPNVLDGLLAVDDVVDQPGEPSPAGTRLGSEAVMALREERWS